MVQKEEVVEVLIRAVVSLEAEGKVVPLAVVVGVEEQQQIA